MDKHSSSRDRQPKFTNDELSIILGEVARHKDVMLSRSLDQETSKFKRQFWQDVAAKLNAVNGHSLRTANEMHFKWRDWKSRTMRKVAHYQRALNDGRTVDEKANLSDIEQRLVLLLAGTNDEDDSDNGNSDDGSKPLGRDDDADEADEFIEADPDASRAPRPVAPFDLRSAAALPTQVNRPSARGEGEERDSLCTSPAPKRPRTELVRNGTPATHTTNGNSPVDHVADAILRHAGDHSVLLFTLLSTQLKQVQDLAESQREQLRVFQEFVRKIERPEQSDADATPRCTRCKERARAADCHAAPERPRAMLDHAAPELTGMAVLDETVQPFRLDELRGSFALVLFYPHDFTNESRHFLLAFGARMQQFQAAGCHLVACSTDSQHSHLAWIRMRKEVGGLGRMDFALLADCTGENALRYNVYNYHDGSAHFAVFIIDDKGMVRHIVLTLANNVDVDGVFKLVRSFQLSS